MRPGILLLAPELMQWTPTETLTRVLPELLALPSSNLRTMNLDPTVVVAISLGAVSTLERYRVQIGKQLLCIDVAKLDKLADFAAALHETHLRCLCFLKADGEALKLMRDADALRRLLHNDARALVGRGLLHDGAKVAYRGRFGPANIAVDLGSLVILFRKRWSEIKGRCAITEQELARADQYARELLHAKAHRFEFDQPRAYACDLRSRAFTATIDAYDEARRAICCLRWRDGDADRLVPSLFRSSRTRRRRAQGQAETAALTD